jgi:hypothetical protein
MDKRASPTGKIDEPDLAPLVCTYCGTEMEPEGEPWPETCWNCHREIDLPAQFAYSRGRDAFIAGQELLINISPKTRRKSLTTEEELEGLRYYTQAYTSLQLAFKGRIAEPQRRMAIEIMAAMALVFQQHSAISPMEGLYWQSLMMELTMQIERGQVQENIAAAGPGLVGSIRRSRWQLRLKQLEKGLLELDQRINMLERRIRFVERPNARRRMLPSL